VGKTSVARILPTGLGAVEVGDLALRLHAGQRNRRGTIEVDLSRLRRAFARFVRSAPSGIVVGHLAHFLPVSYVVVLRCHPIELDRRLKRDPHQRAERESNLLAETLDIVLVEALSTGVSVREVDTTHRSVSEVARIVGHLIRRRPPARYGEVNWLADRGVTEELLRGAL
jgi:adenylate kinase